MLLIDFQNKDFIIQFDEYIERDEFINIISFFKKISIFFQNNNWTIPYKRIGEVLMWLDRYQYPYKLTSEAKIEFQKFKDQFMLETTFYRSMKFHEEILTSSVRQYEFQKEGINWAIKRNRIYLADDKGLGKTFQAIAWFSNFYYLGMIDFIFIIVKPRRALSWKYEILDKINIFKEEDIGIISNENKVRPFEQFRDKKIVITPNHHLGHIFASYRKDYDKVKRKLSTIRWNKHYVDLPDILGKKNLCFVYDEAHEANNSDAIRTKAIYSHRDFFNFRFLASATPAIESFEKWWMSTHLLDSSIVPMTELAFKIDLALLEEDKDHLGSKYSIYDIQKYDYKKIDNWRNKFNLWALRRLKRDLKEKTTRLFTEPIYFELEGLQKQIYQAIVQYEVLKITEEYDNITYKLIIQKFPYLLQSIDNPLLLKNKLYNENINNLLSKWTLDKDVRINYLDEVIKTYVEKLGEKLIIYDNHPTTLQMLAERYKKYHPIQIHGVEKDNEETSRQKEILFNNKKSDNRIALINPIVIAGWNLSEACNKSIFNTIPNYALPMDQAMDRTDRIISERDSFVEFLLIAQSLDIIRYKRVFSRIELNNGVLDQNISKEKLKDLVNGVL